ncbi:solute carrier family 13 member 1 isoform X6 [Syngnathoides biaculeatus]|uniref:solute carrier family 13 member 1 isoform X6 n=1 Tax=Syngnathoides biaculeatus TaxID=300417 RepID=UPI002ADDE756|nr:solute carrier family 13 member 1 isoform X6 [Syngnathoides biaculeatus]
MTISSVAVTSLRKTKRTATKGLAPHLDAFLKAGKVQRSSGSPRAGWQLFNAKIRSAKAEGPHGARKPFGGRLWSRDDRRDVEKVAERGVELPTGALHRGDAAAAASSSSGRRHQGGVLRLRPPADGRLLDHRSHPAGRHRHVARRPLSRLRHHDVIAGGDGVLQGLPLPVGGRQLPGRLHPEVGSPPEGGPPSGRRRGGPAGPPDAGLHVGLRLPLHVGAQHLRRRHGDARRRGRPPPGPASRRGGRGGRGATPAGPATGRDDHKLPEERSPSSSPSSSSAAAAAAAASNSTQAACATAPPTDLTLGKAMCIGVAYASNIGGIATLPGTSPNLIFFEYLRQIYPECNGVNFGKWLALCLPISVLTLLLTWAWLCWLFIRSDVRSLRRCGGELSEREKAGRKVIRDQYAALGPMRSPGFFPGWASFFPGHSDYVTDATVALVLGILFFLVPAHGPSRKYGQNPDAKNVSVRKMMLTVRLALESMITWEEFQASMPWKVALLVGGGFALAEGTKESGLSRWVSELLTPLGHLPPLAAVAVACVVVTTVTEVASNAATISIFLPILSPLAEVIRVNPLSVLIPATLCTSFSFLLPASNPPNAVVFAYGHFSAADMVKAGLGANVIGLLAVLLAVGTWGVPLFSLDTYPDWAPPYNATAP